MIRAATVLLTLLLAGLGTAQFAPIIESVLEATEALQVECAGNLADQLAKYDFAVNEATCAVVSDDAATRFLVANISSGISEVTDQGFVVFGKEEHPDGGASLAVIHLPSLSVLGIAVFIVSDGGGIFIVPLTGPGLADLESPTSLSESTGDPLELYDSNNNGRISCAEAREHGIAPVTRSHPAYEYMTDRNRDGVVCE